VPAEPDQPGRPSLHPLHPLHAVLLAGALPLFLGALLSDYAYSTSFEIQWKNFASWLILGALLFSALALLLGLIDMLRADRRAKRRVLGFLLLLAAWITGFVDTLIHTRDAWASMPEALILSVLAFILALAATWLGFSTRRPGDSR